MFAITGHRVQHIRDPYGIIPGERYEFHFDIEVAEEDELFSGKGLYVRVIYSVEQNRATIAKYEIREKGTDRYLDFELEDDEIEELQTFCREHLPAATGS